MRKFVLIIMSIFFTIAVNAIDVVFCSTGDQGVCVERNDNMGFVCNPEGSECGGTWIAKL